MEGDWKLIYYHEDQHYELYNLADDIGEEHNVLADHPQRSQAMQIQLTDWLSAAGAKFPSPDPQFDASKRAARWEALRTNGLERLERQHAGYLRRKLPSEQGLVGQRVRRVSRRR